MTPDANGWLPSDKHMEAARATVAAIRARHECGKRSARSRTGKAKANASLRALEDIEPAIATALANAEREGMKRAAEKTRGLAAEVRKQSRNDIERCLANALETSANAILSEAGEKA